MYTEVKHPLIQHKLSILRSKETGTKLFRELVGEITQFLAYEALRNVPTVPVDVETPLAIAKCEQLKDEIVIVPILRAGLGMVDGLLSLVPAARVGHIGLYRDPETHLPVEYYCKLPPDISNRTVILVDPMLATGGSASDALDKLKARGVTDVRLMCLVGAPEGIRKIQENHPDVNIFLAAVDEKLNEKAYIVPGLGDAGDRIFGTI